MADDEEQPYQPPTLTRYGTVEDLTEGFGGDPTDAESGSQP